MTSNDSDLLTRLQTGEPAAQHELFQRCQQRLRPYFSRRLPSASDVEDSVSEVLTRALEGIRNGQQPEILDAWLFGIAHNVTKGHYAEAGRRDAREIPEDLPEPPSNWEILLGKRELGTLVYAAIDGIKPTLQPLMRAHYELSLERHHTVVGAELAVALGMSRKRVDRQLDRARDATLDSVAALVLARTGRDNCPQLAQHVHTLLSVEQQRAGHSLILNPKQSKAISAHTSTCPICGPQARDARDYSKWALPPVLPLTEDDEERRRTALAFLSRTNSSPTTATSSATVLPAASTGAAVADETATTAGLLDRIRNTVVSALTRMPGSNTVMHLAQQDPELFRRIVGAAAGLGVVIVAAAAWFAVDAARNDTPNPPPVAEAQTKTPHEPGTNPSAPGANPGVPGAGPGAPGAEPGAPGAEPGAPGAEPGAPGAEPGAPGGNPGAPGTNPGGPSTNPGAPGGEPGGPGSPPSETADISFDATALSYPNFAISNMGGWWDTQQVKTLRLRPGQYTLVTIGPTATRFTVTQEGRVDYDPSLDGVLSGRGSSTLVLRGASVQFDPRALSYPNFSISGMAEWWDTRQVQTLRLLPGPHTFVTPGPTATRITVGLTGGVNYDSSLDGVLSGRGTTILVLRGAPINFDARASFSPTFAISGVRNGMDARQIQILQLLPGPHTVVPLYQPGLRFTVTLAGRVDYDPSLEGALGGRGTTTLTIR